MKNLKTALSVIAVLLVFVAVFCLVTQLLWSMEQRPVPTRAEVLDIYNGVLDGADSLMLTGETAAGKYPAEAMDYLVKTARTAMAQEP